MTEAEARDLQARCDDIGSLERWAAGRPWRATPTGWQVAGELQRWRFELGPVPEGLRVSAIMRGVAKPTIWIVA